MPNQTETYERGGGWRRHGRAAKMAIVFSGLGLPDATPIVMDDDHVLSTATLGTPGESGAGAGSGGEFGTTAGSSAALQGLVINVTYDSSVANAPAGFVAAFTDAVQFFETTFTDPITIDIDVGYGNVGPDPVSGGAAGQSITYLAGPLSYADTKTALAADAASAADAGAVASLAATDPTGGGNFVVSTAQAKALGLLAGDTGVDGYVGFSTTIPFTYDPNDRTAPGKYDFIGVAEHEISEVMGRIALVGSDLGPLSNTYSVLDLFRYSAAGTHQLVAGQPAYFSVDGGTIDLRGFNTISGGDDGDWNSAVVDAANAFVGTNQTLPFSAADITAMDAIGYDVACYCRGTRILTDRGETPVEAPCDRRPSGDAIRRECGRSAGSGGAAMPAVSSPATATCCRS